MIWRAFAAKLLAVATAACEPSGLMAMAKWPVVDFDLRTCRRDRLPVGKQHAAVVLHSDERDRHLGGNPDRQEQTGNQDA